VRYFQSEQIGPGQAIAGEAVAVTGVVEAFVFFAQVAAPLVVEVAVGNDRAELEDGLGSFQAPSGPAGAEAVDHKMP
jgi:hypothetical protein